METTYFTVIRHGETKYNRQRRIQGFLDAPLNDLGRHQAARLARELLQRSFDLIFSSDLQRAYHTALPLARAHGHEIARDERLREQSFGTLEGKALADIAASHGDTIARLQAGDLDVALGGGETQREFDARIRDFFEETARQEPGRRVLVFTHGGVLRRLAHWLDPDGDAKRGPFQNTGVSELVHQSGAWQARLWNDVSHLEESAPTT